MQPLKDKKFDIAEKEKYAMEEQQRHDKKNRHAREKERGPKGSTPSALNEASKQ